MIRLIEDNDTLDAIRLMKEYVTINGEFHGFNYNEAVWMRYFLDIVEKQKTNPHYLAIGDFTEHNIQGFLTAHAYVCLLYTSPSPRD